MEELLACLKWYIETDETNMGQPGNEYFEQGKINAIKAVKALDPSYSHPDEYFVRED